MLQVGEGHLKSTGIEAQCAVVEEILLAKVRIARAIHVAAEHRAVSAGSASPHGPPG